jgi:uncharacterized protein
VEQLVRRWIAARWWLWGLGVLSFALLWPVAARLSYDRTLENMLGRDDPRLRAFRQAQRLFGGDEIILAVYEDERLLEPGGDGLLQLQAITDDMQQVAGVAETLSLAQLDLLLRGIGTSIRDLSNPVAVEFWRMFTGYTHSADGEVAAIVCVLEEPATRPESIGSILPHLRMVLDKHDCSHATGVLVGEPVMVYEGFRYVEEDARRLRWLSLGLLSLILAAALRSLRWVLIAVLVVEWTTVATQAVLYALDMRLSLVSSMLTSLVTVIGVATVMHVALGFRDERLRGASPDDALRNVLLRLAAPISWACLTDAVGFGALWFAEAGPVHDFGLMMAIASLLLLLAVLLWLPAIALVAQPVQNPAHRPIMAWMEHALPRVVDQVQGRRALLAVVLVALTLVALAGLPRLRIETDFTRNFQADSPIARAYDFVEQRLGGAGAWEVIIPAPEKLTDAYVDRVIALEQSLRKIRDERGEPALTSVLSLADTLWAARRQEFLAALPVEFRARGMQALLPDFLAALRGEDERTGQAYVRILLRAHDRREAASKLSLIAEVRRQAESAFPSGEGQPSIRVTGFFVLLTNLVAGLLRDQWLCFAISLTGIGAMMTVALRSPLAAIAALVANTLPVLILLGFAGWSPIKMNMGVAMIAAVAMGLSVDSSLHYLFAYRRALRGGAAPLEALRGAHRTVGRAVVLATLALAAGFASLCTSQFVPTVYFGGLGSVALVAGLLGNLLVLPLMLQGRRAIDPAQTG